MFGDALGEQRGAAREEARRRELGCSKGTQDVDHVRGVEAELVVRLFGLELGDAHLRVGVGVRVRVGVTAAIAASCGLVGGGAAWLAASVAA